MSDQRDPRIDPRKGDQLRDETGRLMTVDSVYSMRTNRKARQVSYTASPGGHGCVCGLSNWRRYYKRAEVEALRPDAERYRWLREQDAERGIAAVHITGWERAATCWATTFAPEDLDAAIDEERAAMAAKEG